jgi:hypothetical protein
VGSIQQGLVAYYSWRDHSIYSRYRRQEFGGSRTIQPGSLHHLQFTQYYIPVQMRRHGFQHCNIKEKFPIPVPPKCSLHSPMFPTFPRHSSTLLWGKWPDTLNTLMGDGNVKRVSKMDMGRLQQYFVILFELLKMYCV